MSNHTHTVLIVDDEGTNLKLMEKVLSQHFATRTASSGEEAIEVLKREHISVLITDQCMPGINGTELLRTAQSMDPTIVGMLMTANNDVGVFIEALTQSGAIRIINKPWSPDDVIKATRAAVERYEALLKDREAIGRLKHASRSLNRVMNR